MKKNAFSKTILILFFCFLSAIVFGQNDKIITIESGIDSFDSRYVLSKPIFHKLQSPLTDDEIHSLGDLTISEINKINPNSNPPIDGVIRNLNNPVIFSIKEITIPIKGEISAEGGRLTRINKDTLIFTTCVTSKNADEIRLFFNDGFFPKSVSVNLFGSGDDCINQHELTGDIEKPGFFSTTIFSDYVIVQVLIPAKTFSQDLHFNISKLTHIEQKYITQNKPASDCYVGANCQYANSSFIHIDELRKATIYLRIPDLNSNLIGRCSGSLLNDNRAGDYQPFILTANHCFDPPSYPNFSPQYNGIEARFDYIYSSCNTGTITSTSVIGANLIKRSSGSDFAVLLLKNKPQGSRTYLGWTTGSIANNEFLHSVNHPMDLPQQYTIQQNKTSPDFSCYAISNFLYTRTGGGQTNEGSSGGAIVNYAGHIVGQLYGPCYGSNFSLCNYSTYNNVWGRFSTSYNNYNLQYWLNNGGATVRMATTPTTTLNFDDINVGEIDQKAITIQNTGTAPNYLNLEAGAITISGVSADNFSIVGNSSLYLSPGRSDDFTINFNPTTAGLKTATLNIPNNADNISGVKKITLKGCAAPAQPSVISGFILPAKDVPYTYTIPDVPGAISYTWAYSGQGILEQNGTTCTLTPTSSGALSVIANGTCASSSPITLDLNIVIGIRVYPNPVSNNLIIEYGGNQTANNFEILNVLGQIIYKGTIVGKTVIQMDKYSSGLYLIKFVTPQGEKIKTVKVIKK